MKERIKTGFQKYDELVGGFEKGMCYIISGIVGCGGTSLALNMANHIVRQHRVLFLSTIHKYSYLEEKQKNLFGDETYKLKEMLPKYQTKEEFEEYIKEKIEKAKKENKTEKKIGTAVQEIEKEERFELLEIDTTKEFLEIYEKFKEDSQQSPEIIFYICHSFLKHDKETFSNFAKEHNVALVIIAEINHIEIRKDEYKNLFDETSNLVAVKLYADLDMTEGDFNVLTGSEKRKIKIYLEHKRGLWRETEDKRLQNS